MNERIKEFILQAGFEPHYEPDGTFSYSQQFEKFAQLIVRECLEQIYSVTIDDPTDDWDQGYDSGLDQAAETIKTHFGVSE